jgi:hypothetical protein
MRRSIHTWALATVAMAVCLAVAIGASAGPAPATAATSPPAATTGFATSTGPSSENLSGVVNPNGAATTYHFEYGTTANYGSVTPATKAGAGTRNLRASAVVTGLAPGTIYHDRLVAVNAAGTTHGADQSFTAGGVVTSEVRVLGREGFVSPGGVIGVELGCFAGQTTCAGHFTVTHAGTLVGQHDFSIAPQTGGFQNFALTAAGRNLLRQNRVFRLLGVDVTVKTRDGQTLTYVVHLARWVWH